MRRSEAAAFEWRDVAPATTKGAILVTVRRSKTDPAGTAADVRYLKTGAAGAVLASELTARGASTTDVMLAGAWKTARMVAHYSAGATTELGAVARYL